MENIIKYIGIKTNNLKNISLNIKKGSFIAIAGPSGSGKSSLAYETIYNIAAHEWNKVISNTSSENLEYIIDSYENIIPAISLKQDNYNTNPRSTICTFLGLDFFFKAIFSHRNKVSPSVFSFNNPKNECTFCKGLGFHNVVDDNKIINWDLSISEGAIIPWKRKYNQKLLESFANFHNIPINIKFRELNEKQKHLLLYSNKTIEKFRVSYTIGGKKRQRQFSYIGILNEIQTLKNDDRVSSDKTLSKYSNIDICPNCDGTRFSSETLQYKFYEKSIGEIYLMEFSELLEFISKCKDENPYIQKLLKNIETVIRSIVNAKLGYLYLNRAIPTLSGGEFQRIRLVNILTSQVNNIMYIVDEPSARLHVSEYDSLINSIKDLCRRGNTIIMIEHNPYFLKFADNIIYIGPKSGNEGGYLMNSYCPNITDYSKAHNNINTFFELQNLNDNNLKNISIKFPKEAITAIYGPSGSGKSTIAKCIINTLSKVEYINQKPLRGSISSTIASYCGLMDSIKNVFSEFNKIPPSVFSFTTVEGRCSFCSGKGIIRYELDFGKNNIEVKCDYCFGKRYNNQTLSYKFKGYNIFELLNLTIDKIIEKKIFKNHLYISQTLELLQDLGLGYLTLFRTTDSLSGGEAQRIKLMKFIVKRSIDKIFIFDEPMRGLSYNDSINLLKLFQKLVKKGATVLFIEHNIIGFKGCDYLIELGPGKGKEGGEILYEGTIEEFFKKRGKDYSKYLSIEA